MSSSPGRLFPTRLGLRDSGTLMIQWNDGQERVYGVRHMRDHCPCASCREARTKPPAEKEASQTPGGLTILSPQEARPLEFQNVSPVGSYAYAIEFSDGHNTGIFTLEHLRQLGEEVQA